jgi:hypothetical protein
LEISEAILNLIQISSKDNATKFIGLMTHDLQGKCNLQPCLLVCQEHSNTRQICHYSGDLCPCKKSHLPKSATKILQAISEALLALYDTFQLEARIDTNLLTRGGKNRMNLNQELKYCNGYIEN